MQISTTGITALGTNAFTTAELTSWFNANYFYTDVSGNLVLNGIKISGDGITDGAGNTIAATSVPFNTISVYATSGGFTVPAGVTRLAILLAGGGGGGGGYNSYNSGGDTPVPVYQQGLRGGWGGTGFKYMTVTPGQYFAFTIGAGGNGGGAVQHGSAGGTSSISSTGLSMTSTGGGGGGRGGYSAGGHGTSSGGDYTWSGTPYSLTTSTDPIASITNAIWLGNANIPSLDNMATTRPTATAAINYAYPGSYKAGTYGYAASLTALGGGGVSGAAIFLYKT